MKYENGLKFGLASVKEQIYLLYNNLISSHIVIKICDIEVSELTPIVLQSLVTDLLNSGNRKTVNGLSTSVVNTMISLIQNSIKTAWITK